MQKREKSDWSVCMGESESAYLCYWVLLLFFFADVNSKKKGLSYYSAYLG